MNTYTFILQIFFTWTTGSCMWKTKLTYDTWFHSYIFSSSLPDEFVWIEVVPQMCTSLHITVLSYWSISFITLFWKYIIYIHVISCGYSDFVIMKKLIMRSVFLSSNNDCSYIQYNVWCYSCKYTKVCKKIRNFRSVY